MKTHLSKNVLATAIAPIDAECTKEILDIILPTPEQDRGPFNQVFACGRAYGAEQMSGVTQGIAMANIPGREFFEMEWRERVKALRASLEFFNTYAGTTLANAKDLEIQKAIAAKLLEETEEFQ
jgi:hypothetical protein